MAPPALYLRIQEEIKIQAQIHNKCRREVSTAFACALVVAMAHPRALPFVSNSIDELLYRAGRMTWDRLCMSNRFSVIALRCMLTLC
jgi:hypothetical protein